MGEIRAKITLENDRDIFLCQQGDIKDEAIRRVTVDALVDPGAVMILLSRDIVEKLGLEISDKQGFRQ